LIVEDLIVLELKAAEYIVKDFENQILNYLRGTDCEVGLLLNFGKKPEFKRKIFENKRKARKN
jgi:GxxExxY protein